MTRWSLFLQRWWPPLAIGVISLCVQWAGLVGVLRFERALVAAEPWRLVTAHVVHMSWTHMALNLAGLALIWAWCGKALRTAQWAGALLLCALGVGLGLYWLDAALAWYVGLSGVLHGVLVLGAAAMLPAARGTATLVLLGVAAKLAREQLSGADPAMEHLVGGGVIINAHLYGAVAGLVCMLLLAVWRRRNG